MSGPVRDNKSESRFELEVDGEVAYAYYRRQGDVLTLFHTEVPPTIAGHGVGTKLIEGALDLVRTEGLKIVPRCSFVSAFLARHPDYQDLLH
jgi:predicted GNAT family acetyltransferase